MVRSVQYVKICSLYGVGFYYVPGTDMCIKIGGWVRAEYAYGDNGNFAWGWANGNVNNRNTNNSTWRARGYITADARNQTEYGTVRGYLAVGLSTNNIGADNAGEHVQLQPCLHSVGWVHVRPHAVVLRLLQLAGDVILGLVPGVGYRRRRLDGRGLHGAVRQWLLRIDCRGNAPHDVRSSTRARIGSGPGGAPRLRWLPGA